MIDINFSGRLPPCEAVRPPLKQSGGANALKVALERGAVGGTVLRPAPPGQPWLCHPSQALGNLAEFRVGPHFGAFICLVLLKLLSLIGGAHNMLLSP